VQPLDANETDTPIDTLDPQVESRGDGREQGDSEPLAPSPGDGETRTATGETPPLRFPRAADTNGDGTGEPAGGGSVLVVGDRAHLREAAEHAGASMQSVPNYLAALGELARRPHIGLLLGAAEDLHAAPEPTARALHRLAPRMKLIVTLPSHRRHERQWLLEAGFDEVVPEPVEVETLAEFVRRAGRSEERASGGGQPGHGDDAREAASDTASDTASGMDAIASLMSSSTGERWSRQLAADERADGESAHDGSASAGSDTEHAGGVLAKLQAPPASALEDSALEDSAAAGEAIEADPPDTGTPDADPFDSDPSGAGSAGLAPTTHLEQPAADAIDSTIDEVPASEGEAEPAGDLGAADGAGDGAGPREIGDVDLVEQLLIDRAAWPELAVRVIRQRLGEAEIHWRHQPEADLDAASGDAQDDAMTPASTTKAGSSEPAIREDSTSASVAWRQRSFGTLHAPATVDQAGLVAWGAWLARWATLADQMDRLNRMAFRDQLTGVWNRRYFERFLRRVVDRAARRRFHVTLMVYDIDDFKQYNDRYGHAAGDEILRETARLMRSLVRGHDIVARVGGDEFAVVFWDRDERRRPGSQHPEDVRAAAQRFQKAVCEHRFPKLLDDAPGTLTISAGLAGFPWDGRTAQELWDLADQMMLRSKAQGKNAITFGPGAVPRREAAGDGAPRTLRREASPSADVHAEP